MSDTTTHCTRGAESFTERRAQAEARLAAARHELRLAERANTRARLGLLTLPAMTRVQGEPAPLRLIVVADEYPRRTLDLAEYRKQHLGNVGEHGPDSAA